MSASDSRKLGHTPGMHDQFKLNLPFSHGKMTTGTARMTPIFMIKILTSRPVK